MIFGMASPFWGIIPKGVGGVQDNYLGFVWDGVETRNMKLETRNLGVGSWNHDGRDGAKWCGLGWESRRWMGMDAD